MDMEPTNKHHKVNSEDKMEQEIIEQFSHDANITEGDEFLDDAIRTKDQPLGETTVEGDE
jgi:hypothetical protein